MSLMQVFQEFIDFFYYYYFVFLHTCHRGSSRVSHDVGFFFSAHISLHFNKFLINKQFILAERNFIARNTPLFSAKAECEDIEQVTK